MIEASQARAGRALIGWSQAKLAEKAGVPLSTVKNFEAGAGGAIPAESIDKISAALTAAGVAFIDANGGGIGVRFSDGDGSKYLDWNELNASNDE
jgi:transcriptional regulator with XRE-family HTH domain